MEEISLENLNLICDYLEANGFEDISYQYAIVYEKEKLEIYCGDETGYFIAYRRDNIGHKIKGIKTVEELENAINILKS